MYPSDLMSEGKIRGSVVVDAYKYSSSDTHGKLIGIMIGIIVAYRVFGYGVLVLKRQ